MRKADLDLCRVIACLAVMAIHTVMLFLDFSPASPVWAVWNLLSLSVRFGVPLFFMLSGVLLLGRETMDFRRHLGRILHLLFLFYAWSAICHVIDAGCGRVWTDGTPLPLLILQGYYHLWFLPALILCYCALPLLHARLHGNRDSTRRGALLLCAALVPAVMNAVPGKPEWFTALLSPYRLTYLGYLAYFPLGWFLANRKLSGRVFSVLGLAAITSLLLFAHLSRLAAIAAGAPVERNYGYLTLSAALTASFVFALCLRLGPRAVKYTALLQKLSGCTLGVYLTHPIFIDLLRGMDKDLSACSAVWLFPLCFLLFLSLSLGVTLLLQKLPYLNKLVS